LTTATVSTGGIMTGRIAPAASATLPRVPPEEPPRSAAEAADAHHDSHLRSGDAGTVAAAGGALRLQTRLLAMGIALGSTLVLVRGLSEREFGQLSLIVALVTIVLGVTDLGLSGVGLREWIRRAPDARHALLADLLGLRLVAVAVGALLAVAFALVVGYDSAVVLGLLAALVGTAFNAVQGALAIPLIAELRQGLVGVAELVFVAVQAAVQVVLVLVGAGVVPIAAALIPGGLAGMLTVLYMIRGRAPWPRFHLAALTPLLRESAAFAAAGAVSVVYLRVAVLAGPAFLTASQFGAFSIAFRGVEQLAVLPALLTSALFPILTHAALHDRPRLARGYDSLWRSTATLGAVTATAVVGAAPLATLVLTGGRDPVTVTSFAVLGCALGALFVGSGAMWMLLAERSYRAVLFINLGALVLNVGLTAAAGTWLDPRWFGLGVLASELVIAFAADRVCRRGLVRSGHPLPPGSGRHLAKAVLAVAAGLAAYALTRDLFVLVPLVAATAAGSGVLLATRGVPPELLTMARDVAGRMTGRRRHAV
jgi:O-antigen/teichoic acid export membrane protein